MHSCPSFALPNIIALSDGGLNVSVNMQAISPETIYNGGPAATVNGFPGEVTANDVPYCEGGVSGAVTVSPFSSACLTLPFLTATC